jgi:serine/threonine-protein kinase
MIYFSPAVSGGLWKVSSDGGKPEQLTTPDKEKGEFGHWYPEFLPGGKDLLFTIWDTALNDARIAVLSQKTGKWRTLVIGGSHARYAPTGHLLYTQSGTLMAAPYDLKRLKIGESRPVLEGLMQSPASGYELFSFSRDGLLCYVRGGEWLTWRQLVQVNRQGKAEQLTLPTGAYTNPRLSPNGQCLAFTKFEGGYPNIWVHKFAGGTTTQLTLKGSNINPVWTPDGTRLTFTTLRAGPMEVYWIPEDGSSTEEPLLTGPKDQVANSWSPDGKVLLFTEINRDTGADVSFLCTEDTNGPRPLLHESYNEYDAVFSPNGHWIAYVTDAEGRDEVYVTRYPGPGEKYKISTDGGKEPLWSPDGRELFYRNGDKVMVVTADVNSSGFDITKPPETLFEGQYFTAFGIRNYDITPDGQRFVMVKENEEQPAATQLIVVLNWFEELKRLVPTEKTK